jgi:tRNA-specific adenosine deaminase 3
VKFWPTVYKKSNVFGPHPSIVSRAAETIEKEAGQWLALAEKVADEAYTSGRGEKIGIVIVERRNGVARPLAVAGDARWVDWPRNSAGNATAHAAMRGIAMVAEQVKAAEESSSSAAQLSLPKGASIFRDEAISGLEKEHFMPSEGEGYLCHDLELYCTHEPCVMCSMAIVHSRFGRLAFKHRMPRTGGLCADEELGHGLWWRKELNWTVLAWQWVPDPKSEMEGQNSDIDMNA